VTGARPGPWLVAALLLVAVAAAGCLALRSAPTPPAAAEPPLAAGFAGTRACGSCHADADAAHRRSGHARTLARLGSADAPKLPPSSWVRDPVVPILFRIVDRAGSAGVEVRAGDVRRWQPARWAFGSGRHGVTLVAEVGAGRYTELPLSHYPQRGWDYTPGFLVNSPERRMYHPAGVPADHALFFDCFNCHATAVRDGADDLDLSHMAAGVQCERCHGPGGEHVRAAKLGPPVAGTIRNPAREPAASLIRLCGECHRSEAPPGVASDAPMLARFAPVGLLRSRCYRESRGRLSCMSCHDPHRDADPGPERSEAVCRSCHQPQARSARLCPVNTQSGCVGCHMPKVEAMRNSLFTDHWIRSRRSGPGTPPAQSVPHALSPALEH
jgi:hypothetical protein